MEEVITLYCKEKGKEDEDIVAFNLALMILPEHMLFCLCYAFNYYRQKYNILELYKVPNGTSHRQVILIY